MSTIQLARIETYAFRVPLKSPIKVAFGTFRDRATVLVRAIEQDGSEGWGEVWCNWPAATAEYRARLTSDIGEQLIGRAFQGPAQAFEQLTREMDVLALQTGEAGPIAAAIAGIDIALWDLAARRDGVPLHRYLGGDATKTHVPVYVTGINPDAPEQFALARQAEGHRAFKLKVGFGMGQDLANLHAMREALGAEAVLTCDANQSWSLAEAQHFVREAKGLNLQWLEEPMRVDAPAADWLALARTSTIPLAGGENLQGAGFDAAIALGALQVIQPDVTKWGGITGNLRVARAAVAAGRRYCPHYFSGGLALLGSLHVLAAAGGNGLLEFDAHPNPNREAIVGTLLPLHEGQVPIPSGPGLGAEPELRALQRYRSWPL
jgi:D-galactarolactone cycloisomerase